MTATQVDRRLDLPVRRARNWVVLAITGPLAVFALWVAGQPESGATVRDWWVWVFPFLATTTGYRLVRPRVPVSLRPEGIRLRTGRTGFGLRAEVDWSDVRRLRVTPALLLVELVDAEAWLTGRPWLVRANVRLSLRQTGAAANTRVRDLVAPPGGLAAALRDSAPVPVVEGTRR